MWWRLTFSSVQQSVDFTMPWSTETRLRTGSTEPKTLAGSGNVPRPGGQRGLGGGVVQRPCRGAAQRTVVTVSAVTYRRRRSLAERHQAIAVSLLECPRGGRPKRHGE